jgi:hypothetical protein
VLPDEIHPPCTHTHATQNQSINQSRRDR